MKKKAMCLLLTLILLLAVTISPSVAAQDLPDGVTSSLEDAVVKVKELYPDAEISIENDKLHITLPKGQTMIDDSVNPEEEIKEGERRAPITDTCESIEAPEGGTYKNFKKPWYVNAAAGDQMAYGIIYFPCNEATAMKEILKDKNAFNFIKDNAIAGAITDALYTKFISLFGLPVSYAQFTIIAMSFSMELYNQINYKSFEKAYYDTSNHGVSITYTTVNGWPMNMYASWEGVYVSASPFESWCPVFYPGEFYA